MIAAARLAASIVLAAGTAAAVEPELQVPMRDPWVPPAVRKAARAEPPSPEGALLRSRVEAKLREPFDRAAVGGELTRARARAAGLGFIDRHFEAIDARGSGVITFDDYRRFLRARGAALD